MDRRLICGFNFQNKKAYTPEEKLELEKKVFTVCKDKEKATDDDVKVLVDRLVPTTTTGKCLLACVHETIGLVRTLYCLRPRNHMQLYTSNYYNWFLSEDKRWKTIN